MMDTITLWQNSSSSPFTIFIEADFLFTEYKKLRNPHIDLSLIEYKIDLAKLVDSILFFSNTNEENLFEVVISSTLYSTCDNVFNTKKSVVKTKFIQTNNVSNYFCNYFEDLSKPNKLILIADDEDLSEDVEYFSDRNFPILLIKTRKSVMP
ncbi:MAG: hypothetical protein KF721_13240, partial [Ignavibacteriaceae bacterium]|nr:hypothetical protein [Ignavibacteriaceae bacterium]